MVEVCTPIKAVVVVAASDLIDIFFVFVARIFINNYLIIRFRFASCRVWSRR